MASKKADDKRILIQKTLFRTVSRNLVRQLHEQGCSFRDLVDFANEILEEITVVGTIDKSMSPDKLSSEQGAGNKNVTGDHAIAAMLHTEGRVNLTTDAYLRCIAESDIAAIDQWRTEKAVAARCLSPFSTRRSPSEKGDRHRRQTEESRKNQV